MQPIAVSTCWNSSRHQDGEAMLTELREMGFNYVELGHGIRFSLWPGVLRAVEAGIVQVRTVHNFCPVPMGILTPSPDCYEFTEVSPRLRALAVKSTLETLEQAALVGAKAVVLHLGFVGPSRNPRFLENLYRRGQLFTHRYARAKVESVRHHQEKFVEIWDRVKGCLDEIVPRATALGLRLGAEARATYDEWPDEREMETVLETFAGTALGYWHDFGHAARKDFLGYHTHAQTLAKRAPYLVGCHVHDCRPPAGDHQALGEGEIDFPTLVKLLPETAWPVLELHPKLKKEQVLSSRARWQEWTEGRLCGVTSA
jgi:sugar phosphate isomerase/epimerase